MNTLFRRACTVVVAVVLLGGTSEAAEHHVLLLQSLDRGNLTLDYMTGNFRVDLGAGAGESIRFTQFSVQPAGFDENLDEAVLEFLRSAFANQPTPDLIVTLGGPAAAFARRHRQRLFPDSPLLFAGVDERFFDGASPGEHEAVVAVANDFAANVDGILELLPDTSTVFMVIGTGNLGTFWRQELERDLQRFQGRVNFIWSDTMSYGEVLRAVSHLPTHSAILHLHFGTDGQGGAYSEGRVLSDIHEVANAPLFGTQDTQIGRGIVGGRLMRVDELVRKSAEAAVGILNGASPRSIQVPVQKPGRPVFDWRELRRWGIIDARLPANSDIRFRQPGIWERFKGGIIAGVTALVAQTLLIIALLVNRAKRRRAEDSLRESEGRFRVLANSAPVMIRMSGPDMHCTDFNPPWLTFSGRSLERELGKGWMDGIHRDDLAHCVQTFERAWTQREPFRIEYRLRRFDAEYRWLLESWQPRVTTDGSLSGYICSAVDVTELKAARATLSNLNHRLMAAQEQERARLARELHDDVGQRMTLLAIELQQLRDTLPDEAEEAHALVSALTEGIDALAKDVQAISHQLHSSKLEFLGLSTAAGSFCREFSKQRGVTIEYVHENVPPQLPHSVAINVFRVLQEAVANAAKHSGASHYKVALRRVDDQLHLDVIDDGCGFDVTAALQQQGLGLISMQERLRMMNGHLTIESRPGAGARVLANVPLLPRTDDIPATSAGTVE